MKKYLIGFLAGCFFMVTATSFASGGLAKVESYLRPDFKVSVDGKSVALKNTPIDYDGSMYLPLRETAVLLGKEVSWNEETFTAELTSNKGAEDVPIATTAEYDKTEYKGVKSLSIDSEVYYSAESYYQLYSKSPFRMIDKDTVAVDKADGSIVEVKVADTAAFRVIDGVSYINVKYFPQ